MSVIAVISAFACVCVTSLMRGKYGANSVLTGVDDVNVNAVVCFCNQVGKTMTADDRDIAESGLLISWIL